MLAKHDVDGDVVFAVAGKPVDLVDEDDVRPLLLDFTEHPLQVIPLSRAGGLSGVDVLPHDGDTLLRRPRVAGFALSGDGVALGTAASASLLTGTDPQVDEAGQALVLRGGTTSGLARPDDAKSVESEGLRRGVNRLLFRC
ncbi:hypothetical protein [Amycolatopsis sp. cmx-4-68]|uniref:hypothetical protein n=1 Tax=Amycolatopsis sp. cmx-4-68 TaxID=2790938 RepID=UPI00397A238F